MIANMDVQPRVVGVEIRDETLAVAIADGRTLLVPLSWYPRLQHATPNELENWTVFEDSDGRDILFWEELDELIPLIALVVGVPSRESPRSFERWLAERDTA